MIKRQIQDWINNGGSFQKGYELFQLAGGKSIALDAILKKRFIRNSDKKILRDILDKTLKSLPDEVEPVIMAKAAMAEPSSITLLREEGQKLKKKESFIHAHLVAEAFGEADQDKLFELAKEMMEEIHPNLDRIYDSIKAFEYDGTLPADEKQKIINDTIEKMNKRKNMRTRIYRLNKWLKDTDLEDSLRKSYMAEIKAKENAIDQIEKELSL